MFDLYITKEVNELIRKIRKELRANDFIEHKSRTNRYIGSMHLNYWNEFYGKNHVIFEIERDLNESTVKCRFYYKEVEKEIRLADIFDILNNYKMLGVI